MSKLLNEVKYRWTLAPWYIKMLDIICWVVLFTWLLMVA